MEQFESQSKDLPQATDGASDWAHQTNRESDSLNGTSAEEGLLPVEFIEDREVFDIDDYIGEFYD